MLNNADQKPNVQITSEVARRTGSARERSPSNSSAEVPEPSGQVNQDETGTYTNGERSNLLETKPENDQSNQPPPYNEDLPSPPPTPSMTPASSAGDLQSANKIVEETEDQNTDLVNEVLNEVKKTESS